MDESIENIDRLTGLSNRDGLIFVIENLNRKHVLLSIDIDNFRYINDTYGHYFGDTLIKFMSKRLINNCSFGDKIFRTGGDEFVILKKDEWQEEQVIDFVEKLMIDLREPFTIEGTLVFITNSIGIFNIPSTQNEDRQLITKVDLALFEAKNSGKDCYKFYAPEMSDKIKKRHEVENRIRQALVRNEIHVHYQPKYNSKTNEITGVEALARWEKDGQIILPNDFIPAAETSRVIIPIGKEILRQSCIEINNINKDMDKPISLAVNVSGIQLKYSDFISTVKMVLEETMFPPNLLDLEITESTIMDDLSFYLPLFNKLNDLGVQITIDDFGTGYSSLRYLQQFPLKKLKVDKSFVLNGNKDQTSLHILKTIIELANGMGLNTVAEGVETEKQLSTLNSLPCDEYQGFYFAKPMTLNKLISLTLSKKMKKK